MKSYQPARMVWGRMALLAVMAALLAGCATRKIEWTTRIGHYTMDQAVLEFGPPDKQARLTDGTVVGEWLTRRGYQQVYAVGGYYGGCAPWYYGPYYPGYVGSSSPDWFLRLTFGPDGELRSAKKFAR